MTQHYKFNNGDVCYDSHGNEFVYQAAAQNGHIVCPVLQFQGSFEEPPYTEFGEPTFLTVVFTDVPTQKQRDDIARLEQEIAAKRAELNTIRAEVARFEKDTKDRMARLKHHKGLENLDRIFEGGITHYVFTGSYPKILAIEDAKSEYENRKLRMLSFQVTINHSTKQTGWYLHQYADGSGSGGNEVIPCFSLEEAIATIKAEIARIWSTWSPAKGITSAYIDLVKTSATYGAPVPKEFMDAKREAEIKEIQANVGRYTTALELAKKELAKKQLEALGDA